MSDDTEFGAYQKYKTLANENSNPPSKFLMFKMADSYLVFNNEAKFVVNDILNTNDLLKSSTNAVSYDNKAEIYNVAYLSSFRYSAVVKHVLFSLRGKIEVLKNDTISGIKKWTVFKKGSSGDTSQFEDVLSEYFNASQKFGIVAIDVKLSQTEFRQVNVAFLDQLNQIFKITTFTDSDCLSNLQAVLVQLCPQEAIVQKDTIPRCLDLLEKCKIVITTVDKQFFNADAFLHDVKFVVDAESFSFIKCKSLSDEMFVKNMSSTCALLTQYNLVNLASDEMECGFYSLEEFFHENYVRIDSTTVEALNLFQGPIKSTRAKDEVKCIFDLLDKCKSIQGKRLLADWMKQPLRNAHDINERLRLVEILTVDCDVRENLYENCLPLLSNLYTISRFMKRKRMDIIKTIHVYQAVKGLTHVYNAVIDSTVGTNDHVFKENIVTPLKNIIGGFEPFMQMIVKFIDFQAFDSFDDKKRCISCNTTTSLLEMSKRMKVIKRNVDLEYKNIDNTVDCSVIFEKSIENSNVLFFCRVTLKELPSVKKLVDDGTFKYVDSNKGGLKFSNDILDQLSDQYSEIKKEYDLEQDAIAVKLITVTYEYSNLFQQLVDLSAKIDVLTSFAIIAMESNPPYCKPNVSILEERRIILKNLRHPLVEVQNHVEYISNNVYMKDNKFMLIGGPNMGGKSTFIRSVALAVFFTQIGCFVPALEADISLVDSILCRLGCNDSTGLGISTFMREMIEINSIIRSATKNSLIIMDEIGRGTSTYDGFGLSCAISQHVVTEIECFCFFATHFHELGNLEKEFPCIKNFYMDALTDNNELILLYKLKRGMSSRSFGLNVAEMVQCDENFLKISRTKMKEFDELFEDYMNVNKLNLPGWYKFLYECKQATVGNHESEKMDKMTKFIFSRKEEIFKIL